jgi:hypothetical protein
MRWSENTSIVTVPPTSRKVFSTPCAGGAVDVVEVDEVDEVEEPLDGPVVDVAEVPDVPEVPDVTDVAPGRLVDGEESVTDPGVAPGEVGRFAAVASVVVAAESRAGGSSVTLPRTAPTAAVAMRTLMTVPASHATTTPALLVISPSWPTPAGWGISLG